MKQRFIWMSSVLLVGGWLISSCQENGIDNPVYPEPVKSKSIVVLYENDVHGAIEGYAKFAGYRDAILQGDTAWVATVSCGDYLQGGVSAAISHGRYVVDVMRKVGYSAVTLGNHEFDYGGPHMVELLPNIKAPLVCANFFEYGAEQPVYAPYVIKEYGQRKVAFVGVVTPQTMSSESYAFYDKDGRQLYDLKPKQVNTFVQQAVDQARGEGADYVVLLSHLGEQDKGDGITSHSVMAATRGIDVVLDGHSHSVIEMQTVANVDGKPVPISQTGTNFNYIGKLLISSDGHITTSLVATDGMNFSNADVAFSIDSVKKEMEPLVQRKVAVSNYALTILGEDGKRLVRSGETNIGDLIADAFRSKLNADIGLMNGGGIRNGIPAGTITYGTVFDALPNDNKLIKQEASGAMIIAMLQKCTSLLPKESGSFPQVSGLRFTAHTSSHTVSDVQVLDAATGQYQPIDESRNYTISVTEYSISGGFFDTLKDAKVVENSPILLRDAVSDYLEKALNGNPGTTYEKPQGRITIAPWPLTERGFNY